MRRCLKRIFISGMYTDGTMFDGKEDHVRMDKSGFEEYAIGDGVSFGAEVYVDYRTCERIPKESAAWYADVIATNGENL